MNIKVKAQLSRYFSAIEILYTGEIMVAWTTNYGSKPETQFGFTGPGAEFHVGWGDAAYVAITAPSVELEIDSEDLRAIRHSIWSWQHDRVETAQRPYGKYNAAWCYLHHVPYWGGVNDRRPRSEWSEVLQRAEKFYLNYLAAASAPSY